MTDFDPSDFCHRSTPKQFAAAGEVHAGRAARGGHAERPARQDPRRDLRPDPGAVPRRPGRRRPTRSSTGSSPAARTAAPTPTRSSSPNGACTLVGDARARPEARHHDGAGRLPQGRLRRRQPGDDVHDRQAEGQGRPGPGRQHRQPVRHPEGADDGRVLARPERGAAGPARLGARLRRRRRAPGRRRVGRARGDALAGDPGGGEDRPVRLRVPRQLLGRPDRAVAAASPTRSSSGATPASGWRIFGTSLAVAAIYGSGTPDQLRRVGAAVLRRRVDEPEVAAFCTTEPEAGSDVGAMRTRAVYDEATDEWVLNGQKAYATNGGIANVHVVTASRRPGARLARAGRVRRAARHRRAGRRQEAASKLGLRASHTADVFLDDVRVPGALPARRQGGAATSGWPGPAPGSGAQARPRCARSSCPGPTVGAQAIGVARAAYEYALEYAKDRVQFGRPIIENQAIAFALADMRMEIDAARLLVWRAAWMGRNNRPFDGRRGLDVQAQGRRGRRRRSPRRRCRSSAAPASCASTRSSGGTATPRSTRSSRARREIQRLVISRAISGMQIR